MSLQFVLGKSGYGKSTYVQKRMIEGAACHRENDYLMIVPDQFTMPELYRLYSQILGVKLDRRNFARKMSSLGILDFKGTKDSYATERSKDLPSRTPSLFSFRNLPTEQSL